MKPATFIKFPYQEVLAKACGVTQGALTAHRLADNSWAITCHDVDLIEHGRFYCIRDAMTEAVANVVSQE